MTEKLFWRSALKAGILASAALIPIGVLFDFILGIDTSKALLPESGSGTVIALLLILGLYITSIFLFGLYAYFDRLFPKQRTIVKALIFSSILNSVFYFLEYVLIEEGNKIVQVYIDAIGAIGWLIYMAAMVAMGAVIFSHVFDHYKKKEQAESPPKMASNLAPLILRAFAFLFDNAIISLAVLPLVLAFTNGLWAIPAIAIVSAYWVFLEGKYGTTIGKKLVGIKVVKENGGKAGYVEAFLRNLWKLIPWVGLIGLPEALYALVSGKKQRFLDKIAGTAVIIDTIGIQANKTGDVKYGGILPRAAAFLVDMFLVSLIIFSAAMPIILMFSLSVPISMPPEQLIKQESFSLLYSVLFIITLGAYLLYFTYFIGSTGRTPGLKMLKLKVVNKKGEKIGYPLALWRAIAILIMLRIILLLPLTLAVMFLDRQKQGIHDKIVGSYVVAESQNESSVGDIPIESPSKGKASIKKTGGAL